jgi:hypothetical protein
MSGTENWRKLYRWWQGHLKSRLSSPSMISDHPIIDRRPSLTSFRPTKAPQLKKIKKRASYSEIDECQLGYNDFRHVRDSVRGKNPRTTRIIPTTTNNKRSVYVKRKTIHAIFISKSCLFICEIRKVIAGFLFLDDRYTFPCSGSNRYNL